MPTLLFLLIALILLFLLGGVVIGLTIKLLGYVLMGLVVGALARLVLPGRQPIGWLMTILAGIAGALAGGLMADALEVGGFVQFLIAVAVAAALIALVIVPRRAAA